MLTQSLSVSEHRLKNLPSIAIAIPIPKRFIESGKALLRFLHLLRLSWLCRGPDIQNRTPLPFSQFPSPRPSDDRIRATEYLLHLASIQNQILQTAPPDTGAAEVVSFPVSMLTTALLTLFLIAPTQMAGQDIRKVSVYGGHVTFEIPVDWVEISPDVLESHSMRLAEASGGRLTEIYQYGFRSGDPEADFFLPECLIQYRESGRLNYRRYLRLPKINELRDTDRESIDERAGPAVREMELSDAVFDRASFSLHLRNTLVLSNEGKASVKSVAFLTDRGLFTMHFYSRVRATDAMDTISARIVASVRFDDELRYRPRIADLLPRQPATILVVVGALIAISALAVHFLQLRRRQS